MQKIHLLAIFTFFSLIAWSQDDKVIHDRNAETRNAKGFHVIRVSQGIDLYLSSGKEEALAVSASDSKTRGLIVTVVEDGVLKIYLDERAGERHGINARMKAYVSFTQLDALHASGGSDVFTEGPLNLDKLTVDLSGGSDLKGNINASGLTLKQSGGSDVTLGGRVRDLTIEASGGSDFKGYELETDIGHVKASGGSDIRITVNKELFAVASGGSDIYYKGEGTVSNVSSGGSETIHKAGK